MVKTTPESFIFSYPRFLSPEALFKILRFSICEAGDSVTLLCGLLAIFERWMRFRGAADFACGSRLLQRLLELFVALPAQFHRLRGEEPAGHATVRAVALETLAGGGGGMRVRSLCRVAQVRVATDA